MRIVRSSGSSCVGRALLAAASVAIGLGCAAGIRMRAPVPLVSVGPNVRVSLDARAPHVEVTVAADSRDTGLLIGAAIVVDSNARRTATYVSRDRGTTWTAHDMAGRDAVDPQVAFGTTGTAYFVDLGPQLRASRSTDHGENWTTPIALGRGYDHPQLGVDGSSGPYRGRMYAAVLDGRGWKLGVFQSIDDGSSWTGPTVFVDGRGKIGYNVSAALVLHDGTLFVPYFDFTVTAGAQQSSEFVYHVWSTTSTDGGATFAGPRPTRTEVMRTRLMHGLASFAAYAVDTSARYRDRIYSVWPDESDSVPRVKFQYSSDRGTTWSAPRTIDSAGPTGWQYQPVVAVNKNGLVGVAWFDTRVGGDTTHYDEFFTTSVDGGTSFIPPVRVSRESSRPRTIENRAVVDRWLQGGDYAGLVADAGGDFHAFWADSRSGTFEVYTARLTVRTTPH